MTIFPRYRRIAVLLALSSGLGGVLHAAQPLNTVVLYADDWRYDTLGCAGNPVVQTPQLDQLARDGLRFRELKAGAAAPL